jgi:hypothetical protein
MQRSEIKLQIETREIEKLTLVHSGWELDKVITACSDDCNFDKVINAYKMLEAANYTKTKSLF